MSKKELDKGKNFERSIVREFKKAGFPDVKRNLGETGGQDLGTDVTAGNLAIQCKRYKLMPPTKFIKEVKDPLRFHALVGKGDYEKTTITLYLSEFLAIMQDIGLVYEDHEPAPF